MDAGGRATPGAVAEGQGEGDKYSADGREMVVGRLWGKSVCLVLTFVNVSQFDFTRVARLGG